MRTFVAIELSNDVVIESIKNQQNKLDLKAKPVAVKNLHFTLQFLGEVSEEIVEKISSELKKIEFPNFDLTLKGIGAFPNLKNPRVIWVGTDKVGGDCLVELSKKVGSVLEPFGLIPDKPFKPHITIFRIKKREESIRRKLEGRKGIGFGIQKVSSIKLKKSQLTPEGPIYFDLVEVKGTN